MSIPRRAASALTTTAIAALVAINSPRDALAQATACSADRTISTLVGAGLGAAAAAIPATIVHRQRTLDSLGNSRDHHGGCAVLQGPILGTTGGERGNRSRVRGILLQVPKTSMSGGSR
jgi:hypothetical protein